MTVIYRILNIRMQVLPEILLVLLVCQGLIAELSVLSQVKETAERQQRVMQHHHFNPYRKNLRLLFGEPPVQGKAHLVNKDLVQELWIEQQVNHFDEKNNKTWLMDHDNTFASLSIPCQKNVPIHSFIISAMTVHSRYLRNDRYFQPHGPIFIFVGGEWEITPSFLLTGHMHDIAKQHNGMLYYVEHRFYGQSWPESDSAVPNLKYLNARQALADLAHFIRQLRNSECELAEAKVLLTGASYSGSLVTWFAKLYPELVDAGWASSAPLLAKVDFYEYMRHVGKVIQHRGGQECSQRLEAGLAGIATLLESSNASQLLQPLRVCNNFETTNQLDRAALFNGIGNYFAAYAQLYDAQIPNICASLISATGENALTAFIEFIRHIFWPELLERTQTEDWCIDLSYEGMKSIFTDTTDRLSGTRQWFYQSCREFGWFATTASNGSSSSSMRLKHNRPAVLPRRHEQPSPLDCSFGGQVPVNYFQQLCRDVFDLPANTAASDGVDISACVEQTNSHFGGLTDTTALQARIIFTHGQLDPWRVVGLQQGKNVINIADYSHTADLDSINFADSVGMNVAKLKVAAFMRRALRKLATTKTVIAKNDGKR